MPPRSVTRSGSSTGSQATGTLSLPAEVNWVANESRMFADDDSPFRAVVHPGDPRLVLCTGENAAGKSLFLRVLAARVQLTGAVPVSVSIRERTGTGTSEMARFRQIMMFGEEAEQSTGAGSVRVVRTAFGNLDHTGGSILGLDEPELGLSDGYARALGTYLGQQARDIPPACAGVVVVTHSRALAAGLVDSYGTAPTFVHLTPADVPATPDATDSPTDSPTDPPALSTGGCPPPRSAPSRTSSPSQT